MPVDTVSETSPAAPPMGCDCDWGWVGDGDEKILGKSGFLIAVKIVLSRLDLDLNLATLLRHQGYYQAISQTPEE